MKPTNGSVLDLCAATRSCAHCALRSTCLVAGAGIHELERVDRIIEQRAPLVAGQTLFHAGEPMRTAYIVRSGALKSIAEHADGSLQVLGFHFPGELLGMDGFGSGRHTCRVEALERSRVCPLPWQALQTLAAEIPSLRKQLMIAIGRETLASHHHVSMMGCPAPRRLALFLREIIARRARLALDPDEMQLSMSREDIANFLGLAEETVCRQFTRLQEDGILQVRRKTVRILDHDRLDDPGSPRYASTLQARPVQALTARLCS